jgi:penicillin-binding protein 1A
VTLSPNGEILAMVGGVDFRKSQFNRATQALRQPGSAFKLFVYLSALGHGYSADSPWVDEPITINKWSPKNWNDEYVGEVTQERAFADSINTVAVKIAQEIGIKRVNKTAYNLGITSTIKPNLSSALGSSEVSLLELTSAYAHIANKGKTLWPHGIQKVVRDLDGEVLYERAISEGQRAIAPNLVNEMTDMLRSVILSGTGKQANFGVDAAGKTGTSQDARDAWFIGFTSNYITGVWLGNDDNSPMEKVGGGGLPALIWKDIMRYAHKDKEQHVLPSSSTPSFWKRLWNKPQENH